MLENIGMVEVWHIYMCMYMACEHGVAWSLFREMLQNEFQYGLTFMSVVGCCFTIVLS